PAESEQPVRLELVDAEGERGSEVGLHGSPPARVSLRRNLPPGQFGRISEYAVELRAEPESELLRVGQRVPDLTGRRAQHVDDVQAVGRAQAGQAGEVLDDRLEVQFRPVA